MYLFDQEVYAFLRLINKHHVEYLMVGGFAVNYHGHLRATGDLDLWWNPTNENFNKLLMAIREFGFDTSDVEHLRKYDSAKSMIKLPLKDNFDIELLSIINGKFSFEEAYASAESSTIQDVPIRVIDYEHLIKNKLGAHRPKDLQDVDELEKVRQTIKAKKKQ